jgi:phosphoglucomutase
VREKDGLWAVLLWLNILADTGQSVRELLADHWRSFGRNYYSRHDYEDVEAERAHALYDGLRAALPSLPGRSVAGLTVAEAVEFAYDDPVDGSRSERQGLILRFEGDSRAVFRLSGTGTVGATLRVYLEALETDPSRLDREPAEALAAVAQAADEIAGIRRHTGREGPDVVT